MNKSIGAIAVFNTDIKGEVLFTEDNNNLIRIDINLSGLKKK